MSRRNLSILLIIAIIVYSHRPGQQNSDHSKSRLGESVSVLGDLLYFQFIFNEGGAWEPESAVMALYDPVLAALVLIIRYLFSPNVTRMSVGISLALISGGAVGNLIDRIRFGKVVDFIDFDFPDIEF